MQTKTTLERLQNLLPDVFDPEIQTGDLYLRFCLSPSLYAAIPLTRIVETIRLPTHRITPIPNMPPYALGLMENHNKIFWALDLAQRLNLPHTNIRSSQHNIIIVNLSGLSYLSEQESNSLLLGLSVYQIQTTLRLDPESINTETDLTPNLQNYFREWFQYQKTKTFLLNVDAVADDNW